MLPWVTGPCSRSKWMARCMFVHHSGNEVGGGPDRSQKACQVKRWDVYSQKKKKMRKDETCILKKKMRCVCELPPSLNNYHYWWVCHKFDSIYRKYVRHLYLQINLIKN
jgi:hypothetical protein